MDGAFFAVAFFVAPPFSALAASSGRASSRVTLGLTVPDHVYLYTFPSVSSYVGGDIVSGVLSSGLYQREELTLYIDIGTNGGIVVGNDDWLMTASCSAGPAFEGGGLKCGMRAAAGAIEKFHINPATLEPMIMTIGRVKPRGICGSGVINILAEFLETGVIVQNGKMNCACKTRRIREGPDGLEYVLAYKEETGAEADVVVTEADVENLIRAKAAMFAGYQCLLGKVDLTFQDLDRVIIAGAFGDYIDLDKAITIGLLPARDEPATCYANARQASLADAISVAERRSMLLSSSPSRSPRRDPLCPAAVRDIRTRTSRRTASDSMATTASASLARLAGASCRVTDSATSIPGHPQQNRARDRLVLKRDSLTAWKEKEQDTKQGHPFAAVLTGITNACR